MLIIVALRENDDQLHRSAGYAEARNAGVGFSIQSEIDLNEDKRRVRFTFSTKPSHVAAVHKELSVKGAKVNGAKGDLFGRGPGVKFLRTLMAIKSCRYRPRRKGVTRCPGCARTARARFL
jgi:hypothetical protein